MERLNPNRSLDSEHILFDCWAVCSLFALGYGENGRKTWCQQENERWQEVVYSIM